VRRRAKSNFVERKIPRASRDTSQEKQDGESDGPKDEGVAGSLHWEADDLRLLSWVVKNVVAQKLAAARSKTAIESPGVNIFFARAKTVLAASTNHC
jgi:hypothetical protein